jgi:ABC-type cobalamin/Fe3+-siderophores transport system ATPase subunit
MANEFQINIPLTGGEPKTFALNVGDVLYVLGANGTGKSSLISRLFGLNQSCAKRISAHRQTWFESNTLDMTPRSRQDLESNFRSQDAQAHARYREWNPSARSNVAIYDLIDADTMQARKIAALVRAGNDAEAKKEAQTPSPIEQLNELMRLSNLPIEISVEDGQRVIARKNGGVGYSVAELSDGERNAFLIAADILTAKPRTLILIDEPERHLHRSIVSPLLKLLFDRRKDCAFIVSTHEIMLPVDSPEASTLLVRRCEYGGKNVQSWTVDIVPRGNPLDEDLKRDLLGARRKMLFVEGSAHSLDAPLYSLLFPQVSVLPKEGCRDVENAVKGLRSALDMHWIAAWGIVDKDQRSSEDILRLRDAGVWALSHYSIESFYYLQKVISHIATRQASLLGLDANALVLAAIDSALLATNAQRDHLVTSAVLRAARNRIQSRLPKHIDIKGRKDLKVEVDLDALRSAETTLFDDLIAAKDWDGLLARYPLRESSAFDRVAAGLRMPNRQVYQSAVLKLLQDDSVALNDLRELLGDLYEIMSA